MQVHCMWHHHFFPLFVPRMKTYEKCCCWKGRTVDVSILRQMDMIVSIWHLLSTSCYYYFADIQFATPFRTHSNSGECYSRCLCPVDQCPLSNGGMEICHLHTHPCMSGGNIGSHESINPFEVSSSLHQFVEFIKGFEKKNHLQTHAICTPSSTKTIQNRPAFMASVESVLVISSSQNY